jgi:hypothetical protein
MPLRRYQETDEFETIARSCIQCGANPMHENNHGQTPLDWARYFAKKNFEKPECQEIGKFLCDWTPKEHGEDDAGIVVIATEISGLHFLSTLLLSERLSPKIFC